MADRLTQAEIARALGVSRQAIHKLVQAGKLALGEDGRCDLDTARAAIASSVHPGSRTAQALQTQAPPPPPPPTVPDANAQHVTIPAAASQFLGNADEHGMPTNYHVARTLREAEEARMARLKREEMEGQLIRVSAVETAWASSLAAAREHLLQVASRLAPLLAAEADPLKIDQMLHEELTQALQLLAGANAKASTTEGASA